MNDPDREARVGRSYVDLTGILDQGYDLLGLLDRFVAASVELLAADAAGILLGDALDGLRVVAASSGGAALRELLELAAEDSPCVECFRSAAPVRVPDVEQVRSRWPEFAVAVNRAGAFRAVHALPLRLRGKAVGVLSLFHNATGVLPGDALALGQALADLAAVGIGTEGAVRRGEVVDERLRTALADRVVVERARGVVVEQAGRDGPRRTPFVRGDR